MEKQAEYPRWEDRDLAPELFDSRSPELIAQLESDEEFAQWYHEGGCYSWGSWGPIPDEELYWHWIRLSEPEHAEEEDYAA